MGTDVKTCTDSHSLAEMLGSGEHITSVQKFSVGMRKREGGKKGEDTNGHVG